MDENVQPRVSLVVTVLLGLAAIYLQHKNNQMTKAMLLASQNATQKKKAAAVPKVSWFRQYWPIGLMVVLCCGAWVPYFLSSGPAPTVFYMTGWGTAPAGLPLDDPRAYGQVFVDGRELLRYQKQYKIAALMFIHSRIGDPSDDQNLSKSSKYGIVDANPIEIDIPLSRDYIEALKGPSPIRNRTTYVLLLIPNDLQMSDFDTIRQAEAAGTKVLQVGQGPP